MKKNFTPHHLNAMRKLKKRIQSRLKNGAGFTLIELLVVISIIAILVSLSLVSFSGAQKQARDTQRRSDLNQIRSVLESYAGANGGRYPAGGTSGTMTVGSNTYYCTRLSDLCANSNFIPFISTCPADPLGDPSTRFYRYCAVNASGALGSPVAYKYILYTSGTGSAPNALETGGTWLVCSNGKVGKITVTTADAWSMVDSFCQL